MVAMDSFSADIQPSMVFAEKYLLYYGLTFVLKSKLQNLNPMVELPLK